ncbi:type II secretion system F family protein [Actinomadura sp. NEAU-AAG7]|uniref:type II secretion system F family protein n=1 Tax=Actinomadura sp. NEAU-AAG7 TaxID=2839640 RepID=UPI001BE4DF14|nr:type II secretion system F family protein [Actinomadura sp. NEAU-AAG7]MBT2206814.1 type II secretion system F family protein [Actinomadura sp. NEAU-AAG7]
MISATGLAALFSSATVWTLLTPSQATRRLDRLLTPARPPAENLLRSKIKEYRERRSLPHRWRTAVIELCDGMAAELAAGRTPHEAFRASATSLDPHVSKTLLNPPRPPPSGHDEMPDHLERSADQPGAEGLRLLAACWRIGAERGGTLATVLDGLAAALRDEEALRQDVTVQLAGPRATARLLAALPLLGVAMAAALGAHPISFLCGSLPGLACLTTGVGLNATGLWWTRRLARAAESPGRPSRTSRR